MDKALRNTGKVTRWALIGVATVVLGGCADSSRLSDPFSDPFARSSRIDRQPTGSIDAPKQGNDGKSFFSEAFRTFDDPPRPQASIDGPRAEPLSRSPAYTPPPRAAAIESAPLAPVGASVRAPASPRVAMHPAPSGVGGWTAEGGTPIVLAQGENADMIAQRYGVPASTLLSLNGYKSAAQVQPGARLVIPVYHANGRTAAAAPIATPRPAAPRLAMAEPAPMTQRDLAPKNLAAARSVGARPTAVKPDAAAMLAEKRAKAAEAKAEATRKAAEAKLQAQAQVQAKARAVAEARVAAAKPVAELKPQKPAQVAALSAAPVAQKFEKPAAVDTSSPTASLPQPEAAAPSDGANPEFRWPARGRVIQAFGAGGNDGINIAVPEGTQVKAAEGGTVAYAGSELKGYGNLVLIRHPNGFVSAYANNGSLSVKRGDTVKRGQTIALSGQSGNVASPQLHFELRKGSKPVDPSGYLAGL